MFEASQKPVIDAVAAIGDVTDLHCWSGIPFHFWRAAQRMGWGVQPWRLNLEPYRWARRWWNLRQFLRGCRVGGYQYSESFLGRAEREVARDCQGRTILSFNHQFPRARSVNAAGGRVVYYLDATLASMLEGHGLSLHLSQETAKAALRVERENLAHAHRIVTMARWLRDYLVKYNFVEQTRISVILPGANIDVPEGWSPPASKIGGSRPFVLGIVGNDWKRKGAPLLIEIARHLRQRGLAVVVRIIGRCPPDLARDCAEVLGPIDKRTELPRFIAALQGCDLGCLFSEREALGISVLEFLRVGVPVAGFAHEGPADTIPPDAGFRFLPRSDAGIIADQLAPYVRSFDRQRVLRENAARWSRAVTWERCLRELHAVLDQGQVKQSVRPWLGVTAGIRY